MPTMPINTPMNTQSFVALDTETTGFSPRFSHLIQISAVRFEDGKELEHFDSWIRVARPPKQEILDLVGVTWEELRAAPEKEVVMEAFKAFIEPGERLVFHNAPFDMGFLAKAGFEAGMCPISDTQSFAQMLHLLPNYKLETVARAFGVCLDNAHNALADARATGEIYLALKEGRSPNLNQKAA